MTNGRQILAIFISILLILQDLSHAAVMMGEQGTQGLGDQVDTSVSESSTALQTEPLWDAMKSYWSSMETMGSEAANQGLEYSLQKPEVILSIATIIGGLAFYKKIWDLTKSAARKIGKFVSNCVYGVQKGTLPVISQLMTILSFDIIKRGYEPLPNNLCPRLAGKLERDMPKDELRIMLKQLVATNRHPDIKILIDTITSVTAKETLVPVPGDSKPEKTIKVQVGGKLSHTDKNKVVQDIKEFAKIDDIDEDVDIIVPLIHKNNKIAIKGIDIFRSSSNTLEGSSRKKAQDAFSKAKGLIGNMYIGVVRIIVSQPNLEAPQVGLSREICYMVVEELTTPAVPWYLLDNFVKASGRSNDKQLMEKIKELSTVFPVEYQAKLIFMFGKYGWTGKFFFLGPAKEDVVDSSFLDFYRAMAHVYFPYDPETLKPTINQALLRQRAITALKTYKRKAPRGFEERPKTSMKLMEIYLELGRCLSPDHSRTIPCNLAKKLFSKLVRGKYKEMIEIHTPRLSFISHVEPGKESIFLKAVSSDISILMTAFRSFKIPQKLAFKLSPIRKSISKPMQALIEDFYGKSMKPAQAKPCINKVYSPAFVEIPLEWKSLYKDLDNSYKEVFTKGVIFLKFGVHPDSLVPIPTFKFPLTDAINYSMSEYCETNADNQKASAQAA